MVITFRSTHEALRAEKVLRSAGLKVTVMPTPKSIKADCGIALRVGASEADASKASLEQAGLGSAGFHNYEGLDVS